MFKYKCECGEKHTREWAFKTWSFITKPIEWFWKLYYKIKQRRKNGN